MKANTLSEQDVVYRTNNSIWKNYSFMSLWISSVISSISMSFFSIALPLIVYQMSKSTLAMSTLRAIEILPNIVLGMLIGALVDRLNRKYFMLSAIGAQSILILLLILLMMSPVFSIYYLYVIGFLFYTSNIAFSNAYHSTVPLVVGKELLVKANSIRTLSNTLVNLVAPAIAGILLFNVSYEKSLYVTLIGYLVLISLLTFTSIPSKEIYIKKEQSKNIWREMKVGWEYLYGSKVMWSLTLMILFVNIATAASGGIFIFFSVDVINLSEKTLGLVLSSSAAGGIIASFVANRVKSKFGIGKVLTLILIISSIGQFIFFISSSAILLCLGMFIIGFSVTIINIYYFSLRQSLTPPELQGRVSGTANMITMLATPLSYLIAGLVGEFVDVKYIFLASSITLLVIFFKTLSTKELREITY